MQRQITGKFLEKDLTTPPLPPLGVKNVKIQENSEKISGPPGVKNVKIQENSEKIRGPPGDP